jgi:cobalt-zinc-cadmium efflux system membrane fusion protein
MSRALFVGCRLAVWALALQTILHLSLQDASAAGAPAADSLDLTDEQVKNFTIGTVGQQSFPIEQSALGSIDFDEDLESQVYPAYQGKLLQLYARTGDSVEKGQILFTIDSPDLVQAESTLISADGVLRLTTRALQRATDLYHTRGLAQKDYDQAVSDQQTADGSLRAARDAVRIFGKTDAEMDRIVSTRRVDPALVVRSPVSGVVVARSGAPGTFVQPGNAPAPFTVADNSVMWMLANVPESLSDKFAVGQAVAVHVSALPGQVFAGRLTTIGTTIDPGTRRFMLRTEVADPSHKLRSGMFADFTITTGAPVLSLAVPMNGIVREGDGTETAWTTTDGHHFSKRTIQIGLESHGYRQILSGLQQGERVVTDGAVFLSNMLTADPSD